MACGAPLRNATLHSSGRLWLGGSSCWCAPDVSTTKRLCIYTCSYVCTYVCMYMYLRTYVCMYACMYVYVRTYVHTYIHACAYIYIHIHVYIYIYRVSHELSCMINYGCWRGHAITVRISPGVSITCRAVKLWLPLLVSKTPPLFQNRLCHPRLKKPRRQLCQALSW